MARQEFLESLEMHYDPGTDVLYCSFGAPQRAIGVETDDACVIRRVRPGTDDLVGFTVADFSKRFTEHPEQTLSVSTNLHSLEMHYDPDMDVLYCSLGRPELAHGVETDDEGVVLRVKPGTNQLVGFTIADFSKRFTQQTKKTISVSCGSVTGVRHVAPVPKHGTSKV